MWLIRIDGTTGLVLDDPSNDGWRAISSFRSVYEKYGIEGLTVIALSCDYLSPFSNYIKNDRPYRACMEIYGDRNYLDFSDPLLVKAMDDYHDLQYNSDMERDQMNKDINHNLILKLSQAHKDSDDAEIDRLTNRLNKHEKSSENFYKRFNAQKLIEDNSIANNGYKLTRIEVQIESRRNSIFKDSQNVLKNPNKLGLETVESDVEVVKKKPTKKKSSAKKPTTKTASTNGPKKRVIKRK